MIDKTLGTFTLEAQFGKGGMREVYQVKDTKLGRDVAIKVLPEQQANLDACSRKGFAIRLNKKRATASDVLVCIDKLLKDRNAKEAVNTFRDQLAKWDGPENAARFLRAHYG